MGGDLHKIILLSAFLLPSPLHSQTRDFHPSGQFKQDTGEDFQQPPRGPRGSRGFPPDGGYRRKIRRQQPDFTETAGDLELGCDKLHNFLDNLGKEEKALRTTSKNISVRWAGFVGTISTLPKASCILPRSEILEISSLLANKQFKSAATRQRTNIAGLDLEEINDCCKSITPGRSTGATLTLDQLAEQERISPTDTSNIRQRWPTLVRMAMQSGDPEKVLGSKGELEGLSQKDQLQKKVKIYKRAVSSGKTSQPHSAVPGQSVERPSSEVKLGHSETDNELALTLFYKAMQYYAGGQLTDARTALDKALELDPNNQEISSAATRIHKDIAIKSR